MSGVRVYEAARKLNMETSELMKILSKQGIKVKSPIAVISQEDVDKAVSDITSAQAKKGADKDNKPGKDKGGAKLALVASKTRAVKKESDRAVIPIDRKVKEEKSPEKKSDKKQEKTSAKKEASKPEKQTEEKVAKAPVTKAKVIEKKEKEKQSVFALIAMLLSATALAVVMMLSSNVDDKIVSLNESLESVKSISGKVSALDNDVRMNSNMAVENQGALADVNGRVNELGVSQAKTGLMERSTSLKELSSSLPKDLAIRVDNLAKDLSNMAGSL